MVRNKMTLEMREALRSSQVSGICNFVVASPGMPHLKDRVERALESNGLAHKSTTIVFEDAEEGYRSTNEHSKPGEVALFWTVAPRAASTDVLLKKSVDGASGFLSIDVICAPLPQIPMHSGHSKHIATLLQVFSANGILILFCYANARGRVFLGLE